MSRVKFESALEIGNMGQELICGFLQSYGYGAISTSEYSGKLGDKAPRLMFEKRGVVLPDLDLCRDGERVWAEVKTYHHPAFNRHHGCDVHGIKSRHRDDYLETEKHSGAMVRLLILEVGSGDLLALRLSEHKPWICQCSKCKAGHPTECTAQFATGGIPNGAYWPRDLFKHVNTFSDEEMSRIRKRHLELYGHCEPCEKRNRAAA